MKKLSKFIVTILFSLLFIPNVNATLSVNKYSLPNKISDPNDIAFPEGATVIHFGYNDKDRPATAVPSIQLNNGFSTNFEVVKVGNDSHLIFNSSTGKKGKYLSSGDHTYNNVGYVDIPNFGWYRDINGKKVFVNLNNQ